MAGTPELAIEVCESSRSYDLGSKLHVYQAARVPEYVAIIVESKRIEWRVMASGRYRVMKPRKDGTLRSRIFPGLWLDVAAFWRAGRAALLATLERGLATESKS
jgi:Uma2 family endonuclease